MSRPRIRSLLSLATAGGLAIGLLQPGLAIGARADKATDHYVELFCDGIESGGGTLFFGLTDSDVDGLSAGLDAFGPDAEPFVDPPTFTADFDATPTGSASSTAVSVDIPVLDSSGDSAGSAHVAATLVVGGEVQPIADGFTDGNHKFRSSGTLLPLSIADGTATLPDGSTFALEDGPCTADEVHTTFFGTNPTSAVRRFDANQVNCDLVADGQTVGNLFVDIDSNAGTAFVDAFFPDAGIDGAVDRVPIDAGHLSTSLDFVDLETGDPAGSGSIDLTVAPTGAPFEYTLRGGTGTQRVRGQVFAVTGTLVAPGFATFDLGACFLTDRTFKEIQRPGHAPKPTGKAPANDVPSGAMAIGVHRTITEQTKNTALDMEAPFDCLTFVDENDVEQPVPVIKTVWFKLVGTGASVTLDTAGTNFDTVVAVYTKSGNALVPVANACVDDVPVQPIGRTLQAAVTFTAAAGTTYFVQVGGFPDDLNWGTLRLSVH